MADHAYPDALPSQYRLHWYVLERVLGQGGFGITYLARDTNLDQLVAIKEYLPTDVATRRADSTVRPRSEDQSERYRWGLERFILEARTLAKFDHPNIVRVLSVFEQNGTAYMVMRFEEGENFGALLDRKHTLAEEDLLRVLLPVLDGLKLVHDAGFIHRDIKPDNIHIRADGSPVLLDFGSARHSMGHARTVTILVAPGYAPFEQYYSSGEDQGPWTDIYSLGATCYRAIAGIAPIDAIARSKGILGSTRELLVPATAVGAGRYSERLLKAIDHALAFAEKERPGTIMQWRRELTGERPAAAPRTLVASASAVTPDKVKVPVARTAAYFAVVASVAVLAGGLGAYLYITRWKPDPPPVPPAVESKPKPPSPDAVANAAEQERKEKEARADAERFAKAERDRQEVQKQAEEEARIRQQEVDAKRKLEAERERKARAEAERLARAERGRQETQKRADEEARIRQQEVDARRKLEAEKERNARAVPECPQQGEVAIYNCYRELARGGDALAALKVGELFEAGRGVAKNPNTAYYWYAVSELRCASGAKVKKDAVAKRLQPLEIDQMDKLAKNDVRSGKCQPD